MNVNTAATALGRLEEELTRIAGVPVALERPGKPEHGDYATNVALRLAGAQKRPPLELAADLAEAAAGLPGVERAETAPPGFLNLWLSPSWFGEALGEMVGAGSEYGAGSAASPERVQVEMVSANPTGPITVAAARNGAYGDSRRAPPRLRRPPGRARVLLQRRRHADGAVPRLGRGRPARRAAARGRLRRRVRRGAGRARGRPGAAHAPPDRGEPRALPHPLRLLGAPERRGAAAPRAPGAARHVRERGRRLGALDRLRRREGPRARSARPSAAGCPTYEAADIAYLRDKLERGFDRAIYVLGADHHGVRGWYAVIARMLGYDPERVEVILYQLVHLTRGGDMVKMSKRRGDVVTLDELIDEVGVDAARWYLAARGPDQAITVDVDLAREKSEKNPVYYVQYAHARIAGHPAERGGGRRRRGGARRAGRGGARPRQAPGRVPRDRRRGGRAAQPAGAPDVRDPARGRLPPLLPPPSRAGERGAGLPPRARHGHEGRDRPQPRPRRGRGARADVGISAGSRVVSLRDTFLYPARIP